MIVVDTNVVVALFVDDEFTPLAKACRARDEAWVAPELFQYEFAAAINKYLRAKRITVERARRSIGAATRLVALKPAADRIAVFDETIRINRSSYDVEFVLLARKLSFRLVTNDGGLLGDAQLPEVVSLRDFAAGR